MINKMLIGLGLLILCIMVWIAGRFFYLKHTYSDMTVPVSTQELRDRMGKPNIIELPSKTDDTERWIYFQFPMPHSFKFYIKKGRVVQKYDEISG